MTASSHDQRNKAAKLLTSKIRKLNAFIDELEVQANLAGKDVGEVVEELSLKAEYTVWRLQKLAERVADKAKAEFGEDWDDTKKEADKLLEAVQDGVAKLKSSL